MTQSLGPEFTCAPLFPIVFKNGDRVRVLDCARRFGDDVFIGREGTFLRYSVSGHACVCIDHVKDLPTCLHGVTRFMPESIAKLNAEDNADQS